MGEISLLYRLKLLVGLNVLIAGIVRLIDDFQDAQGRLLRVNTFTVPVRVRQQRFDIMPGQGDAVIVDEPFFPIIASHKGIRKKWLTHGVDQRQIDIDPLSVAAVDQVVEGIEKRRFYEIPSIVGEIARKQMNPNDT